MKSRLKKAAIRTVIVLATLYVAVCGYLYFGQEGILFFPEKLGKKYTFDYSGNFEELNVKTSDGILLNGLLFKADSSKGLVFYLHGNAGSLGTWGDVAQTYADLGYDVFMPDYRGYGKSEGEITSEEVFFSDVQLLYDEMKKKYAENEIIVLGYSIGTGPAAKIASANKPKMLILQAPYFSLTDMMRHEYPIIPTFLLKYKFATNEFIPLCTMPVVIFHGDADRIIYYESSVKLMELCKKTDTLITLRQQGHNGMTDNPVYRQELRKILNR